MNWLLAGHKLILMWVTKWIIKQKLTKLKSNVDELNVWRLLLIFYSYQKVIVKLLPKLPAK